MSAAPASPKPPRKSRAGLIVAVAILGALVFLWNSCSFFNYENKDAAETIAAAVRAYQRDNGRYPARLEDLVPRYLAEIPQAGEWSPMFYAAEPGGAQCWIAYGVHRDDFQEYDCLQHTWQLVDYDDSKAVKHPARQALLPARSRH
jgi:hypothetical protein